MRGIRPRPPAKKDHFGVRAGRTTPLDVLNNDSAGQCGIIAITENTSVPESFGQVQLINNGRGLQIDVARGATGTAEFTYTITDGRGKNPPSTTTVTIEVSDQESNQAPVELRKSRAEIEQGATLSHNALANFRDPDGDPLVLESARVEQGQGTVRFRKDGMLTYIADSTDTGPKKVALVVSDGTDSIPATLTVDVRAAGTLAPTVNPIHRVAHVSSPVEIDVLSAVKNRSTEPVRLAAVDEVAGTSIAPDLDSGTFTFSAPTPGSYYVNLTLVSSPHTVTALARIDVREWPEEPLGPVAVSDVALLPAGGEVTVAPLANDFDPNGGVMVLTGIELEEDSRLSVGVIEHRYVKIESGISIDKPEVIHYFVDNGYATSRGTILVTPVEPSVDQRAPEIKPIDVTVRAGGVVTIPVLDYVSDADGDTVKLSQELPEPLPADQGLLFVSGDVLRYQAPDTTGTTQTHFVVEDSAGNTAVGTLNVSIHESTPETKAPPTPKRITARAYAGETIRIYTPLTGIDVDGDGVTLLGQGDVLPSQGYVSAVGADWIEYTASLTGKGTDTFTYAVEDWTGQRALGTVRVGIVEKPRDALPIVASDDEVTVQPGTTVEVRVTRNDVDPSGLDLTVDPIIGVTQADVEVNEKRVVVKVPEDASGTISIPYTVRNTVGGTATAVLRVRVSDEAVISQPVAKDIVVAPHEVADKISAEVDVLAVAENPSGPLSDLDISIPASHAGNASVTGERKVLVTLGKTAQTIPFKLTNKKSDGKAYTYAFISVPALGDFPPVLRPKARALKVASGGELLIPLTEFVQVGPGKTPHILDASSVKAQHSDGSSLVVDEETLQFTSKRGYEGTAAISFEVWDTPDETGKSSILTIPITVFPEDGFQPTFSPTVIQVPQGDEPVSVDLGEFTKAPSGTADESYGYRLSSAPTSGFTTSISGSILTVQAPASLPRGTKGNVSLTVSYGLAGTLAVTVPFEVVASTKALPIVNDHVVVASAGKATTLNALQGAVDPVGKGLRVVRARNLTESVGGLTSTDGKNITIVPPEDFSGTMKIAYVVTDALNDVNRNVEGVVEVTVRKEPDAPSAPRVSNPTNRTVTVAWDAPNSNGTPVLDYRVTAQPGGKSITCVTTTCEFSGLNNGTPYRFTVAARNAVGHSPESALSAEIVPDVLPLAPERPTVEGGDQRIEASWTQPQNDGSPITSYIVEVSPGLNGEGTTTKSVTSTSTTLTGAKNGTAYMVRVRAVNSANTGNGAGPWSAYSESVIPAGPPAAPTVSAKLPSDTPLGRQIQVSWNSNGANGDPITGYSLVVLDGNTEVTSKKFDASTTSWTFSDAQNGVDYKFAVRARNRAGQSEPGISETISSFTAPSAPQANATSVVPSRSYAQGGALALGWGVPTDTGGKGLAIAYYEIKDVAAKVSGTSYIVENLPVGQPTGGYDVRACNERGACSGWTRLNGGTPVTKPQAPTLSVSAPTYSGTYNITVTPRNEGGLTATHQYRIDGGAWKDVKGTIPPFSVNDFGDADSKDVRVEARSMNEQGSSPIVENVVTVTKPQLPGAPQNISSSQDPNGDTGDVLIEWQKAKEQGIAIQRYGYCLEAAGTDISCKHTGNGLNGETTRGPNDLKAAISDLETGSGHTLKVWAITADGNGKVATFVFSFPYYSGGG
ncbi:Ig-like domain-containing protein [Timonella sp. A28]|uniref:Ig-like domain-containing protein n=1 Tax=Timonella sp. A28 TaxID=3442640 RepID=UPI003EBAD99F